MEAHEVAEWQSLLPGDCPFPLDTGHAPFAEFGLLLTSFGNLQAGK